jgi:hypothetical protein
VRPGLRCSGGLGSGRLDASAYRSRVSRRGYTADPGSLAGDAELTVR